MKITFQGDPNHPNHESIRALAVEASSPFEGTILGALSDASSKGRRLVITPNQDKKGGYLIGLANATQPESSNRPETANTNASKAAARG